MTQLLMNQVVPLQVPLEVRDAEGKIAQRASLTLRRPRLAEAKQLAVLVGPELAKALMATPASKDAGPEAAADKVDARALVVEMVGGLASLEHLDALTRIIAALAEEKPETLDQLDWVDLPAVLKALFGFFPALQSIDLSSLAPI